MRGLLPLAAGALALLGCSADEAPGTTSSSSSSSSGGPTIEALYGPQKTTRLTPFPSDRYAVPDPYSKTGLRVKVDSDTTGDLFTATVPSVVAELGEMDGFTTHGGVALSFSAPLDIAGLTLDDNVEPSMQPPVLDASVYQAPGAPLYLLNVDHASPEFGRATGLVVRYWGSTVADDGVLYDEFTLIAQPAIPLLPSTRYLFVGTRALRGKDGSSVARSKDTDALLTKDADPYAAEVQAAMKDLEGTGLVKASDVVVATAFTTATLVDDTLKMATRARSSPPPAQGAPWSIQTPMTPPDKRVRFRATYHAPEYRAQKPDGKWKIGSQGPIRQKDVELEVYLAFSDASVSGPRPVVIYQHGLGGSKDGSWGTTERLAALGCAVFSIDSPEHDSRSQTPDQAFGETLSFFGVDPVDNSFDIGRARDNFRQMTSDQLELVRFIRSLDALDLLPLGHPDGIPDLDTSRILYIGHSFGSVQGPAIFAVAPEIKQAVWNVGGDGLMTLLRDSGTFKILVDGLKPAGTPEASLARFFVATQALVDPGDSINYARFANQTPTPGIDGWGPRDVLLQEVIDDAIVPNSTSEALARATGLTLADPIRPISGLTPGAAPLTGNAAHGATGAISQFDKIEGGMTASHGELIFSPEAQNQYVAFFASGLKDGHATVARVYPKP